MQISILATNSSRIVTASKPISTKPMQPNFVPTNLDLKKHTAVTFVKAMDIENQDLISIYTSCSERPGLLVMGNNMNPMGYPPDMGDLEMENLDDQLHDSEYMEDSKMTRARRMRLSWRTKML